jgi:hypothetical protein
MYFFYVLEATVTSYQPFKVNLVIKAYKLASCQLSKYKSDFRTFLLNEILNFAWFSHRQALKKISKFYCYLVYTSNPSIIRTNSTTRESIFKCKIALFEYHRIVD